MTSAGGDDGATLRDVLRLTLVLALIPACASTPPPPSPAAPVSRPASSDASPLASSDASRAASAAPAPPPLGPEERTVLRAVETDATVLALCADSARRGGPCVVYVDAPGDGACPPDLGLVHPCLWTVVVGSNMGTHVSRRATMLVRPDGVVVAAANLYCPPMAPRAWAEVERASLAGRPVEDCPPGVPDAPTTSP